MLMMSNLGIHIHEYVWEEVASFFISKWLHYESYVQWLDGQGV